MKELSAGPAIGAYQVGKALNQVLIQFRIAKVNCPDQPPLGYEDFIEFLRAAHEEASSYWQDFTKPAEEASKPKKRTSAK